MVCKSKIVCAVLLVGFLAASPAAATITVYVDPPDKTVLLSEGTTTVDITADIPMEDAIVGWGMDLDLLGTSVSIANIAIGPLFDAAISNPDGDGLAALVPLGSLYGTDLLLATVTFNLNHLGSTGLVPNDDNPPDLTEGFALNPPPAGAFATVIYCCGAINVVPEPASLVLLALGGLVVLRRR